MKRSPDQKRCEFEDAVLPHVAELSRKALRLTRNLAAADDLLQDTLLRAYAAWGPAAQQGNTRAWLFRILTNQYITGYRQNKRRLGLDEKARACGLLPEATACGQAFAHVQSHDFLLSQQLSLAIGELDPENQALVKMAMLEDATYREIADAYQIPLGTVMSRLFRLRKQLRAKLADSCGLGHLPLAA